MNKKSKIEQLFILLAVFTICLVLFATISCSNFQEIPTGNGNSVYSCGDSSTTCLCGSIGDKPVCYYGGSGCLGGSAIGCEVNENGDYYKVCGLGCGGCIGCIIGCSGCDDINYGAGCPGCHIGDIPLK